MDTKRRVAEPWVSPLYGEIYEILISMRGNIFPPNLIAIGLD